MDLPEMPGRGLVPEDAGQVECPQCGGTGLLYPGATCGMWVGLVRWPADLHGENGESCDLCDGTGEVTAEDASSYEQAVLAGCAA